jgi:hypothetical protein
MSIATHDMNMHKIIYEFGYELEILVVVVGQLRSKLITSTFQSRERERVDVCEQTSYSSYIKL